MVDVRDAGAMSSDTGLTVGAVADLVMVDHWMNVQGVLLDGKLQERRV